MMKTTQRLFANCACVVKFDWKNARALTSTPFALLWCTHTRNAPTTMPAAPKRLKRKRTARLPQLKPLRADLEGATGCRFAGSRTGA